MRSVLWVQAFLRIALCIAYPVTISTSFFLYNELGGVVVSRSVSVGMASHVIQIVFGIMSLALLVVWSLKIRLAIVMVFSITVLLYLYPYHPLRAMMFSTVAIVLTLFVESLTAVASNMRSGKKPG